MRVEKRGFKMRMPLEMLMDMDPEAPQRKGHYETPPLTDEDRAAHARAVAAMEELDSNPWVISGWEGHELLELAPRSKFVPEETFEEYDARVQEWLKSRRS